MRLKKFFLWTMIVSLLAAAGMGVIALLSPHGAISDQVLLTSLLGGAFGLATLMCSIVLERGRLRPLMWVGIVMACVALALWMAMVWAPRSLWGGSSDDALKSAGIVSILAALIAHIGLLALPGLRRPAFRFARVATQVLATMVGLMLCALIVDDTFVTAMFGSQDSFFRVFGVTAILDVAGTITVPLLARVESTQGKEGEESTIGKRPLIHLTCPRCERPQEVRAGKSKCAGCGLAMTIEVEEPRCACGYLLYGLAGDKCPECGKEIAEGKRWASAGGLREPEAPAKV